MTVAKLWCTQDGQFCALEAEGHAGSAVRGTNVVCAAVTMLLRTTLDVLEHSKGITVVSDAPERGVLNFRVRSDGTEKNEVVTERLICTADYLKLGLSALAKEYPDEVSVECFVEQTLTEQTN